MKILVCSLFATLLAVPAWSLKLKLLASQTLPHKMKFKGTRIGGLSGIWFDQQNQLLYAVSDDRGTVSEPRFYEFLLNIKTEGKKYKLELAPKEVHFIKFKDSKNKISVLDLEAMTVLPWGNFLISSEGDNNKKPRQPPVIMDVKKDGTWVRNFEIPDLFIPEPTAEQKKGIINNQAFEGLTSSPSGRLIWMINESPLLQDKNSEFLHLLQYEMPEAWVIKFTKEYFYPYSKYPGSLVSGVSEILGYSDHEVLSLERSAGLSKSGVVYFIQVYLFDTLTLKKTMVMDLDTIKNEVGGRLENYEGLSWGPEIDKKKTILMISDDNFGKSERTQLLLFSVDESI